MASIVASVAGLLAFLCFLATPFMPVQQTESSISWPQNGQVNSVIAPQMSYTPQSLDIAVPCTAIEQLPADGGILVSTTPAQGEDTALRGLFVRATKDNVEVTSRGRVIVAVDRAAASAGDCSEIRVHVGANVIDAAFVGMESSPNGARVIEDAFGLRPSLVGIYTDLPQGAAPAGLSAHAELDSRFTSSPSVLKWIVMVLGIVSTIVALVALHRLDALDGRRSRRWAPSRMLRLSPVDGVVAAILLIWHVIGANTSDDGYILSMARVASDSYYMANYYRWYGVPESPFGSPYYDLLGLISHVSTNSMWMRLPELIAGLLCWLLLSKEVIPRLGRAARTTPVVAWTAAAVFLAFWTAFNNGLRPEPIIAFGALLTWCSIERAIATRRLLPAAIACIIAAFSLATGPTGLMAVAALLAGARPILGAVIGRSRASGGGLRSIVPLVAPILAAGTTVLVVVFGDQSIAAVREAIRVRGEIGPNLAWYQEFVRYYYLLIQTVDGSLSRRLPMLLTLLCLAVVIGIVLKRGGIPGAAKGPTMRLVIVVVGTMFFMMFSPTKWTHHFGVYAGIGAAIAGLAALAIYRIALNSSRTRTLFLAVTLLVLALAASGINGWWYVSSFGIPWWDRPPSFRGINASTVLLALAVLVFILAAFQHLRADYTSENSPRTWRGQTRMRAFAAAPVAVIAALLVVFNVASLAKGAYSQYPAYSVGLGNARSLAGNGCMLANDVLVEPDAGKGTLAPVDSSKSASETLEGTDSFGFDPNGVARDLTADSITGDVGTAGSTEDPKDGPQEHSGQSAGTAGGAGDKGVNGSSVALPFGLDPQTTPVLGSYKSGAQSESFLDSGWYSLPEDDPSPLLVVSAAGRVAHYDVVGAFTYGQDMAFQFGHVEADGSVSPVGGKVLPQDIGPNPSWRNLRVPRSLFPEGANAVKITIRDGDLDPEQWLAVTPPRLAQLESLQDYVGSDDPVLLDWAVGLQFPCQRPFGHHAGVAEVPKFRILPDRPLAVTATSTWEDYKAGGLLGLTNMSLEAESVPSYLRDNWNRDWGSLERFTPYGTYSGEPVEAQVDTKVESRSGMWEPDAKIFVTNPE
ncbi:arabinosyltransferase domain-containing protein [Dietzia sp.]|uniref:arabinosyltransferase domain-containing protein n=1 Tax=Dietzia sp. TaxID=1871616 RepID=UPI002FDB1CCF